MSIRRSVTVIVIAALVGGLSLFTDARGASGQITFVQQLGLVSENGTIGVVITQAPAAAGNSIVVAFRGSGPTSLHFQCSDPVNGIYHTDVSGHLGGVLAICSIHNIAPLPVGSAITVQVLGARRVSAVAYEFAGLSPTATLAAAASDNSLIHDRVFTESFNLNLNGDFLIFGAVTDHVRQGQAPTMQPYSKNCPGSQPLTVLPALPTVSPDPFGNYSAIHLMHCMTSNPNVVSYRFGALFNRAVMRTAVVVFYRGSGGLGAPTPKEPGPEDPEAPNGPGSPDDDGLVNANDNALDNFNLNANLNDIANTQVQSNEQQQTNDNDQVATVNSSPSVVIDFD